MDLNGNREFETRSKPFPKNRHSWGIPLVSHRHLLTMADSHMDCSIIQGEQAVTCSVPPCVSGKNFMRNNVNKDEYIRWTTDFFGATILTSHESTKGAKSRARRIRRGVRFVMYDLGVTCLFLPKQMRVSSVLPFALRG